MDKQYLTNSAKRLTFLVLLYGTLDFDGRAQRMIKILHELGHVTVVEVLEHNVCQTNGSVEVYRVQVFLKHRIDKIRKHIAFWWTVFKTARRVRPSVVVLENFFTTLPGWVSARWCKSKLVYDAYELIIPEHTRTMSLRDNLWYLLERWVVRRADLIIAANEERANLMAEHYKLKQMPTVLHNIPLSSHTESGIKYQDQRRTTDEIFILYQGYISLSRGIDRFIRALDYLGPQYRLVIIGGGPDLERLRIIGEPFEHEGRFIILDHIPHRQLLEVTALADIGIVTYPYQGLNNIYCASNKLFEYAIAGLPVVATDQPPLKRLVKNYCIGMLIGEHDNPEQVADRIRELAQNKNTYKQNLNRFLADHRWDDEAERAREAIVSIFTKELPV